MQHTGSVGLCTPEGSCSLALLSPCVTYVCLCVCVCLSKIFQNICQMPRNSQNVVTLCSKTKQRDSTHFLHTREGRRKIMHFKIAFKKQARCNKESVQQ